MARVKPEQDKTRLVDYLAENRGISKGAAKKLVDAKEVYVNGKPVWMSKHLLKTGDDVIARAAHPPTLPTTEIEVLLEEHGVLVLNKPAGILTHKGNASLEAWIRKQEGRPHLQAAHRLDKDTSGCIIFSDRRDVREHLVKQFRKRSIKKRYHVLVKGNVRFKERTIRSPIEHREAVTHLIRLHCGRSYSLLGAEIETGRKHQIRIHLHGLQHPVAGDKDYRAPGRMDKNDLAFNRMMLHAASIHFRVPKTGRAVTVRAPLPEDMRTQLDRLGIQAPGN
jgi:RluA family pseudouridine synthase